MQIINQTSKNVELQELWSPILQTGRTIDKRFG